MQYPSRSISIFLYALFLLLSACARQGAPTGGPKDTRPPEIDTLGSTPNFSTRFDQKRIELKFDEWVVLSEVAKQIVVSPPLAIRPEVVLHGKTVVVNFDKKEVLRPNTTYTVNFGTAVKDLHEGNPAKDLRFVFSTGDFIDSLSFRGVVTDGFTGEPIENISVMLYENFADSAVRKERPYYFTRTDKSGQYEFKNLRASTYRVVAIEDGDQNLRWNGESERIGFRDSALALTNLSRGTIQLQLFKNSPKFRLVGQNANRYGLVKLGFSVPLKDFETQTMAPEGLKVLMERSPDSLMLWYDLPGVDTSWNLLFTSELSGNRDSLSLTRFDTIEVKKNSRSDFMNSHRLAFGDTPVPSAPNSGRGKPAIAPKPPAVRTLVQTPSKPADLLFNYPISAFDTARWELLLDSIRVSNFTVLPDSASPRKLLLQVDWKQGKTYTLRFLPGALTDFWGTANPDTLGRLFNILSDKQLGNLSLTLEKLIPGTSYVLQLLNGTVLEDERIFTAESDTKNLKFNALQVAAYSARLVEDRNKNGRWDTGDFENNRQPERIFNKKMDPLRANWDLEVSFSTEAGTEKKRKQ